MAPVILISDEKNYVCPHMDVSVFRATAGQGGLHSPWEYNLKRCLESINIDLVLYLQEDYFLTLPVDVNLITEFSACIAKMSWTHEETMHVGLCARSSHGPFHLTEYPLLLEVDRQARYRFSLLPGLWNRRDFLAYIRASDSACQFEETSHIRGRRTCKRVLTVNRHGFA